MSISSYNPGCAVVDIVSYGYEIKGLIASSYREEAASGWYLPGLTIASFFGVEGAS